MRRGEDEQYKLPVKCEHIMPPHSQTLRKSNIMKWKSGEKCRVSIPEIYYPSMWWSLKEKKTDETAR